MKNKIYSISITILLLCSHSFSLLAQVPDWNSHGNISDSSSFLGNINYKDLRIATDSITRVTISKDGDVNVNKNLNVSGGYIKTDTIKGVHGDINLNSNLDMQNNWIHADSLRCRVIHVGDSSLTIGVLSSGTGPTQNIISSGSTGGQTILIEPYNGITAFGNSSPFSSFPNCKVGIGTQTPADKLHLYSSSSTSNYLLFTNGSNSTTTTDGFEVGIMGNGSADLNLRKNAYLYTRTNNIIRTWLDPSGNFGIGLDPTRKLDVIDGAAPQLRLSQHTATFTNMPDVYTDFQTTSIGDLFINPTNATDLGSVGIGESAPSSKLEINDGTGGAQLELTFLGYKRTRFTTTTSGNLVIKPQAGAGVFGHTFIEGNTYTTGIPNFTLEDHGDFSVDNMDQAVTPPGVLWPVVWDATSKQLQKGSGPIGSGWTTACSTPTLYYLTKWTNLSTNEICNSQIWDDGTNVGIGTNTPVASNFVQIDCPSLSSYQVGLFVNNPYGSQSQGIYSIASCNGSNTAISGQSLNGALLNRGVTGVASLGLNNYGVVGLADHGGSHNYGGDFEADDGTFNIGVAARGGAGTQVLLGGFSNIGVYAGVPETISSTDPPNYAVFGNVGSFIGGFSTNPDYAGYFNGDVATTTALIQISDSIFKDNIQTLTDDSAMFLIRNLKPKTFDFDTAGYPSIRLPIGGQIGLISEDVQFYLPQLIKKSMHPSFTDSTGAILYDTVSYLGLNYTGLIPICIGAIKSIDSTLTSRPSKTQNAIWIDTLNQYEWGTTTLKHNTEVPMIDDALNEWNIYYTGQSLMQNMKQADIGVGYDTSTILGAKVDVLNTTFSDHDIHFVNQYAGRFYTTGDYNVESRDDDFAGVYGNSDVTMNGRRGHNMGGDFTASNSSVDIGARGWVYDDNGLNEGISGIGENSQTGIGVDGLGNGTTGSIGVTGTARGGSSYNYGIQGGVSPVTGASNYAGYFAGNVYCTGSYLPSDAFLKQNIQPLSNTTAISIINALHPSTYNFNTTDFSSMNLPSGNQYGLISEQVEQVLPDIVKTAIQPAVTDTLGNIVVPAVNFKAMNYTAIVPLLIASIQQMDSSNTAQQLQNELMQNQLTILQQQVQQLLNCCQGVPLPPQGIQEIPNNNGNNNSNNKNQTVVELNNYAIILDQNSPNPFAEQTTITFIIPKDVKDAQILFSDDKGSVIKTVQINTRGAGSLLVYASNLSSGIYTYSLLADGKLIDTKKMVCQKR